MALSSSSLLAHSHIGSRREEYPGYFKVPGAYLYTVLHRVEKPVGRILLVGSFGSERHFSYYPWVRWARYLAARQIEVLRYDYRGIGESTGMFDEMSFNHWEEDVRLLASWLRERLPFAPLLLNGLEMGTILAGKNFEQGYGDALLLWSPVTSGNQALRSSLVRWAGQEQMWESPKNRKPASAYIRQLEDGLSIEVAGYQWQARLWRDSFDFVLPPALGDASPGFSKPVRISILGKEAAPLVKPYVGYEEARDLTWLYEENFQWVSEALSKSSKAS